jgi:hypothetical protein
MMTWNERVVNAIPTMPKLSMRLVELYWQREILQRWVESPQTPAECLPELREMLKDVNLQLAGCSKSDAGRQGRARIRAPERSNP